jgi:low affinity Fe/Cu permease
MVFLIQRAQNKDALAIHLKLNEIVAAMEGASNRLIDVEDLSEAEIGALHNYYRKLIRAGKDRRQPHRYPFDRRSCDQATAENTKKTGEVVGSD